MEAAPVIATLSVIGIIYGALAAWVQHDMKKLVAYSSVSHLGFCVLGLCALTVEGVTGAVYQMLAHGISTGALFLLVGILYERRHTRMLADYGGIAQKTPIFAFFFVFAVLSSVGLPGLNGFIGEWMNLLGSFHANPWLASIAVTGVIFGAVYLLSATRRLLFGPITHDANRALEDLDKREVALLVPMVVLCVWIGVAPNGFLGKTAASIDEVFQGVEAVRAELQVSDSGDLDGEERSR
jgi:NADH-quinone oxidoreductase subunit M